MDSRAIYVVPRQFFKKISPRYSDVREAWYLRPFKALIHDPSLWATHRKAVVPAVAAGMFIAFIPVPLHPLIATVVAIIVRINLPVILVVVWVSNPLTIGPILLAGYSLGSLLLGRPQLGYSDLIASFDLVWQPLLLGLFVMGSLLALVAYFGLNLLWRWATLKRKRTRRGSGLGPKKP